CRKKSCKKRFDSQVLKNLAVITPIPNASQAETGLANTCIDSNQLIHYIHFHDLLEENKDTPRIHMIQSDIHWS
ncbi:MAG: hypothetical protein JXR70_08290, partial [Spirochaetales bacterium]|nr:hypothetical protein [Spirochaetales bacterium]